MKGLGTPSTAFIYLSLCRIGKNFGLLMKINFSLLHNSRVSYLPMKKHDYQGQFQFRWLEESIWSIFATFCRISCSEINLMNFEVTFTFTQILQYILLQNHPYQISSSDLHFLKRLHIPPYFLCSKLSYNVLLSVPPFLQMFSTTFQLDLLACSFFPTFILKLTMCIRQCRL